MNEILILGKDGLRLTPETNTSQFHIVVHKLHDSERLCCHFISYNSQNPQFRCIFLAGSTFLHIGLYRVPRFGNRSQQNHIFFCSKWHGLPLQWQHCLKEDVHKWTLRCRIVIYPKSPGPNKRINPSLPLRLGDLSASCIWLEDYCAYRGWEGGQIQSSWVFNPPFSLFTPSAFLKPSLHIRARYCYQNSASRQSRRNYGIL